jgi:isopentenyl-diphosphate delta-isomerase
MDELIDILTPEGTATGKTALKSEAHKNGWFHATAHIWFFTSDEKILLQKRALTKKVFPGIWDISVAGHIGAGEEILEGAKREVFEEIGIEIQEKDLIKIGTELKVPISTLTMQEEEVAGLELWELTVLKETKNLENVLLPGFHTYYVSVYNEIAKYLKKA